MHQGFVLLGTTQFNRLHGNVSSCVALLLTVELPSDFTELFTDLTELFPDISELFTIELLPYVSQLFTNFTELLADISDVRARFL